MYITPVQHPKHIPFNNQRQPTAGLDMVRVEDMLGRTYPDHSPFDSHLVEFYILLLVEEGRGTHTLDFVDIPLQPGTLLSIRKDQVHRFHPSTELKGTMVLFTDAFLVSYLEQEEALRTMQLFNEFLARPNLQLSQADFALVRGQIGRMQLEYGRVHDAFSLGILRSELHILASRIGRLKEAEHREGVSGRTLRAFVDLQQLVERNSTQTRRVQDYAAMMGTSTKTLNNVTQAVVHKSAKAFIDELCTLQVQRMLINTSLSIKKVAYHAGFEETTNFYKYFRRQTGTTPEAFRQASRG